MDFRRTVFVKSAPSVREAPGERRKEVLLLGRSNVGKSSLLNALTGQELAYRSKKAGKTMFLNYFLVDGSFYLVDSPGYGYTSYGSREDDSFSEMMEGYFESDRKGMALLLVDGRRGIREEERDLLSLFEEEKMVSAVIYTKADTLRQQDLYRLRKEALELGESDVLYSYKDRRSVPEIRGYIARRLGDVG